MLILDTAATHQRLQEYGLESPHAPVFSFFDEHKEIRYNWHRHPHHQLLYALTGTIHLDSENASFLLPPQCAAWVPAGVIHRTAHLRASTVSVFFSPDFIDWTPENVVILAVPPLLREMVRYAARWQNNGAKNDPLRNSYFQTIAGLCKERIDTELPFQLPAPQTTQLSNAVDYMLLNLGNANLQHASRAAATSPRTLRRQFAERLGLPWRDYLRRARVLKAIELLSHTDMGILDVAIEVGFDSSSAFSTAFSSLTGEPPSRYRDRVRHQASRRSPPLTT